MKSRWIWRDCRWNKPWMDLDLDGFQMDQMDFRGILDGWILDELYIDGFQMDLCGFQMES